MNTRRATALVCAALRTTSAQAEQRQFGDIIYNSSDDGQTMRC